MIRHTSFLLGLAFAGTILLTACGGSPYGALAPLSPKWTSKSEGENYIFKGRVVDTETGRPIEGASASLELIRVTRPASESIFQLFGYGEPLSFAVLDKCNVVDSLGSTSAYPKVNALYRRNDIEQFIFQRETTRTDSSGLFQLRSTKRLYKSNRPEGSYQRIVVKKEGYRLFSQGVLSKCKEHLQALRPVKLVPKSDSTSERTDSSG